VLPHRLYVPLETPNPALDKAAVTLKLCLPRTSGADTTPQAFEVRPTPGQARQKIFLLSKLDLQSAFVGACSTSEDIQDEGGAVDNLGIYCTLQIALLCRGEFVVEDNQVVSELLFE
jgi:hypothetical protein